MNFKKDSNSVGCARKIVPQYRVDQKLIQLMCEAQMEDERTKMPRRVQALEMLILIHVVVYSCRCPGRKNRLTVSRHLR
jgi:hypothetical protein